MNIFQQRFAAAIVIEARDPDVELACTKVNGIIRNHTDSQEPVDALLLALLVLIVVKRQFLQTVCSEILENTKHVLDVVDVLVRSIETLQVKP